MFWFVKVPLVMVKNTKHKFAGSQKQQQQQQLPFKPARGRDSSPKELPSSSGPDSDTNESTQPKSGSNSRKKKRLDTSEPMDTNAFIDPPTSQASSFQQAITQTVFSSPFAEILSNTDKLIPQQLTPQQISYTNYCRSFSLWLMINLHKILLLQMLLD